MTALFVTGTDTGVGKSVVTASIARALHLRGHRLVAMKPYASGVTGTSADDVSFLQAAAATHYEVSSLSPVRYVQPLAPWSAEQLERLQPAHDAVVDHVLSFEPAAAVKLVEGIGGAAVPLGDGYLVSDFIARLQMPALIVARSALGTINHSLLTIGHLARKNIPILGIVYVRHQPGDRSLAEQTSPEAISAFAGIRDFGTIPFSQVGEDVPMERRIDALPVLCDAIQAICQELETAAIIRDVVP